MDDPSLRLQFSQRCRMAHWGNRPLYLNLSGISRDSRIVKRWQEIDSRAATTSTVAKKEGLSIGEVVVHFQYENSASQTKQLIGQWFSAINYFDSWSCDSWFGYMWIEVWVLKASRLTDWGPILTPNWNLEPCNLWFKNGVIDPLSLIMSTIEGNHDAF